MPRPVISDSSRSAVSSAPKLLGIVIKPSAAIALAIQRGIPMISARRAPRSDQVEAARPAVAATLTNPLRAASCRSLLPHVVGQRQRLVGALQELAGHKDDLLGVKLLATVAV